LCVYRDKEYLFDHDEEQFFSQSTRSRIIEFLLKRKRKAAVGIVCTS
jgi:hypothetical protein